MLAAFGVHEEGERRRANRQRDVAVVRIAPKRDVEEFPATLGQDLEGGLGSMGLGDL